MKTEIAPISIVIPTAGLYVDGKSMVLDLSRSLIELPGQSVEIIVVLDKSQASATTREQLMDLNCAFLKVVDFSGKFNFAKKCNLGAQNASHNILLFLNDDIEIPKNLDFGSMVELAQKPSIGAVGCVLTYPNGLLQHAGITLQDRKPRNAYAGCDISALGELAASPYQVNAVTGACMMIEKSKFELVGGWDEELPNSYNDVDICLALNDASYQNWVDPTIQLIHREAQSRNESFDIRAYEKLWVKHGSRFGTDDFLRSEPAVNAVVEQAGRTSALLRSLRILGIRGSFWAVLYKVTGRTNKLLGPNFQ